MRLVMLAGVLALLIPPVAFALPLQPAPEPLTLTVAMDGLVDRVTLRPYDPRTADAATERPDAAQGIYRGTLTASGATLHLVWTPEVALGLLDHGGVPRWVTLEGRTIVPLKNDPGTLGIAPHSEDLGVPPPPTAASPMAQTRVDGKLQVFLDGDYPYYRQAGNRWAEYQLQVTTLVSAIFEANFGIPLEVVRQNAWTTWDPFEAGTMCGGTGTQIHKFAVHWQREHPVPSHPHEVTHLFTGRVFPDALGCAYVYQLDEDWSYGITSVFAAPARLKEDALVMAHEVGHNFGGLHERALPTPGGRIPSSVACTAFPVTIMYPGCQTAESPLFSDKHNVPHYLLHETGILLDGGNAPHMRAYAAGRV